MYILQRYHHLLINGSLAPNTRLLGIHSVFTVKVPCIPNELQRWFVTTVLQKCTTTRSNTCLGFLVHSGTSASEETVCSSSTPIPRSRSRTFSRSAQWFFAVASGWSLTAGVDTLGTVNVYDGSSLCYSIWVRPASRFFNDTDDLTHLPFDVEVCRIQVRPTVLFHV